MKCPNCQLANREEAIYCRKCGKSLQRDIACPACGSSNPPDSSFCEKCGRDLREPTETPSIDFDRPKSYTPKFLAEKILTTRSSIEGERKLVTVLFADIANYTSIAEKLDPEEVHQIMDECFKILMDEIHKYEGTINQFTGDGVMALFGAPVAHEDHAQRSCYAALSIQMAVEEYGEKLGKDHGIDFKMRIGLNLGPVIVGSIGDDLRMDYTAVGDTTNVASRMQSMAQPGSVLVSQTTHKIARDYFEFQSIGKVEVKGKKAPVEAFELIKVGEVETRIEASAAKGLTRFVGRKNSMAALMEAYEKAISGAGQVVGMVGEAGVGKSRLILEMRNRISSDEFTYLEGRCLQYGGTMAYLPILDILRSYFDIKEGDREHIIKKKMSERICHLDEALMGSLNPLQEILSLKVDDEAFLKLEPKEKRERTFEAIRDILIRESQNQPLIVAVEDLHWIDKTSEEFLDYLIGWLVGTRVLLMLLYRPEYSHSWGSKSYYNRVGLDHLGTESSAELVQAILEGGEVTPELKELVLNRAAGNPLFMEEFTHTLLENGSIQKQDGNYVLTRASSEIEVPETIQGIIAARMDRLEDNLKRTLQVASVIGRDFAFRILKTITGMREELKSYLLNLQGLEFIYEKRLFPELEYNFKHALIQEVAYNSLLLARRKEIHEKIAEAIEQIYAERLEEFYEMLAYHYSKSGQSGKAHQYLKLSGEKSTRSYSNWEAFRFYKGAIDALNHLPDTEGNKRKKLEVLHLMEVLMRLLGWPEDTLLLLEDGERLSKEIGDEKGLAIFSNRRGIYHLVREGNPLPGIKYGEQCFQQAEKTRDIELTAKAGWDLGSCYWTSGQFLKQVDVAQKVVSLLEATKREYESFWTGRNVYSAILGQCGSSRGFLGDFGEGRALLDKALGFASKINDRNCLAIIEWCYGWLFTTKGDGKNAIEHFQNALRYMREIKFVVFLGLAWTGIGWGHFLSGELKTAMKCIEKGLKIQSDQGVPYWACAHSLPLSMVHFESNNLQKAKSCVEKALRLSQHNHEKHWEACSRVWFGRIWGKTGAARRGEAEQHIFRGMEICDELKLKPYSAQAYLFLGELCGDMDQREEAFQSLKKAEEMFHEMGMDYWLSRTNEAIRSL